MVIKTITCHDVYNVGASLQAYALQQYLKKLGHDVEIINYKPDYLRHYRLWWVPNPKYNKLGIRILYNLAKFPGRFYAYLMDPRKKAFDVFTKNFLKVTSHEYKSFDDLLKNPPIADVFIAGSDQIWNPLFQNGKDPSFYLEFVSNTSKRISYAASFAVDEIPESDSEVIKKMLSKMDHISVREESGLLILDRMELYGIQVCDPVFLLEKDEWESLISKQMKKKPYLLVYDFDQNMRIKEICQFFSKMKQLRIVSVFPADYADDVLEGMGPEEFLNYISNASLVISNSFHATAFSIIFHKEFVVVNRKENINTRMRDLLKKVGLSNRLITDIKYINQLSRIEWDIVDEIMNQFKTQSKDYIKEVL